MIVAREYLGEHETLVEHIQMCMNVIKEEEIDTRELDNGLENLLLDNTFIDWLEEELKIQVVKYHDLGKQSVRFQNKIVHGSTMRADHSMHSAMLYLSNRLGKLDKKEKHYKEKYRWYLLNTHIIAKHHSTITPRNFYQLEEDIKKYMSRGLYDEVGKKEEDFEWVDELLYTLEENDYQGNNLTAEEYIVMVEALDYLKEVDGTAAYRFEQKVLDEKLTETDIQKVQKYKEDVLKIVGIFNIELDMEETLRKYIEKIIGEKEGD